jgi:hypothetical protein
MKHPVSRLVGVAALAGALTIVIAGRASAPAGHYVITNGTVYDTKTKLTWQQVVSPSTYTQPDAVTYCAKLGLNGAKWRLPTVKELATIIDYSVPTPGPTIDSTAFPNTPAEYFWSSTPYFGILNNAWSALFLYGLTYGNDETNTSYARCVH